MMLKKLSAFLLSAMMTAAAFTVGCAKNKSDPTSDSGPSTLVPVDDNRSGHSFKGIPSTVEETLEVFASADGICRIEKKKSYYDVYLDYEKADYYTVGKDFGETILKAYPGYADTMEPYLYENIAAAFTNLNGDYSGVEERVNCMLATLDDDYRRELEGFCDGVAGNVTGYSKNGVISREEAMLFQFVPDVLRPTSCSAISVNGNKTKTGERFTARLLEWQLGSENQICTAHCVMHMKNGEKSYTAVSILGMLTILTAVNDNGVMAGEFDVGSYNSADFVCDGRRSYTYAIRHAVENYDNARDAAEYMVSNASRFTFNVNVMFTDKNDALCCELALDEKQGTALIRDSSTPLHNTMTWDDPDFFCIVNTFAAAGNADKMTGDKTNIVRWVKYNNIFCPETDIDLEKFKELLCAERQHNYLMNFRGSGLVHMALTDYSDHSIHVLFTGTDTTVDEPEFISVGKFD